MRVSCDFFVRSCDSGCPELGLAVTIAVFITSQYFTRNRLEFARSIFQMYEASRINHTAEPTEQLRI